MIAYRSDSLRRLRSAVADLDPSELTISDAVALLDLVQAATRTESTFGQAFRKREAERAKLVSAWLAAEAAWASEAAR